MGVVAHALQEEPGPGVQVDDGALRRDAAAVLLGKPRAAAGRDDCAVERAQFGDRLRLACAETRLALDVEDHRNAHPAAALDRLVQIVEGALQPAREQPADGGLAGAHHADKDEVVALSRHTAILRSWKNKRPGSPAVRSLPVARFSEPSGAR